MGHRYRQTWRSSGNAAFTSAGMNSGGKARSKSLSSVKVEVDFISEVIAGGGGYGEGGGHQVREK